MILFIIGRKYPLGTMDNDILFLKRQLTIYHNITRIF